MKNERIAMAATLVLAIIISLPNFLYPLFEDAALYSLIGHLMGDGLLPYRDLLDQKPPAIYWTTFLFDLLVGPSNIGLRAMELVTILLMGFACGLSAREISGKRWALPAGILLTTCLSSGLFWAVVERGQVEWYQATACAWAVYFAVLAMRTSRARHLALAGGMASLACWYKPQAAIFALGMASVLFLFFWRTSFRQALRSALWIAGAAVAASSPFVLWMLATGIFDDFVTVMFVDNAQYLQHSPIPTLGKALQRLFFWPWLDSEDRWLLRLLTGAGLAGFLLSSKTSDNHHRHFSGLLVLVWAGAALAQYLSGRYLFRYHSLIFIPIAALLLTLGMTTLVNLYRDLVANHLRPFIRTTVKFAVPLIVAITLLSNPKYGNEWASTRSWLWGSLTTEKIYHAYGKRLSYYEYRAQELAAEIIKARTRPGDRVQLIGRGGTFYLFVDRLPATPYLVTNGLFDTRRSTHEKHFARFMKAIKGSNPAFILIRRNDAFPWFGLPSSETQIKAKLEFLNFLKTRYSIDGNFGQFFWVLKRVDYQEPTTTELQRETMR